MATELEIPESLETNEDAVEMIRFWLSEGDSVLSLNLGIFEPEHEVRMWGYMIADIAKHAVRGLRQGNPELADAPTLLAQLEAGFHERLQQSSEMTGEVQRSPH